MNAHTSLLYSLSVMSAAHVISSQAAAAEVTALTASSASTSITGPTPTAGLSAPTGVSQRTTDDTSSATSANEAVAAASSSDPALGPGRPTAIPSYFRIDHDHMFGLQLWGGAAFPLTNSLKLATDFYIAENSPSFVVSVGSDDAVTGTTTQFYWGEFDVGPSFTIGGLTLTPMVGVAFDWAARRAVAINGPQLYTTFDQDHFYFESWVWTVLFSAFRREGANDYIHTRNWVLYKLNDAVALGPQVEYSYDLEAKQILFGLPIGGHVELAYGTGNSLGLFLAYDTNRSTRGPDNSGTVGRLTFMHNF